MSPTPAMSHVTPYDITPDDIIFSLTTTFITGDTFKTPGFGTCSKATKKSELLKLSSNTVTQLSTHVFVI